MTKVLLEIGAHGDLFLKKMRDQNPRWQMQYLCGTERCTEIWNHGTTPGDISHVKADFFNFGVPDKSLDVAVCNNGVPLIGMPFFEIELVRSLKVGGVFMSAHVFGLHMDLSHPLLHPVKCVIQGENCDPHEFPITLYGFPEKWEAGAVLKTGYSGEFFYPATPEIVAQLTALRLLALDDMLSGSQKVLVQQSPSLRVWVKRAESN